MSRTVRGPRAEGRRELLRQRLSLGVLGVVLFGVIAALAGAADDRPREGAGDAAWSPTLDGPILTEVVSSNGRGLTDEDGDRPDWIEVHNPTDTAIGLAAYALSDDDDDLTGWRFPDVDLAPGGYLVVFASGKDRADESGELHTNFRISRSGEPVLLLAPDTGSVIDRFPPVEVPRDASFGRDPADLARMCFFAVPTPGEANAPECFDDVALGVPTFSVESGFHDESLELELTPASGGGTLLYTLDGSYPDLQANPHRTYTYDGPIRIEDRSPEPNRLSTIDTTIPSDQVEWNAQEPPLAQVPVQKGTVVRARSPYGAEGVATYFVGDDLVRDDLPVLSLILDEDFLFDPDIGIYVAGETFQGYRASDDFDPGAGWRTPANYHERGRGWERPPLDRLDERAVLEVCPDRSGCPRQFGVGVRVHGNHSRIYPQKSLRLYARNDYGNRVFDHAFFGPDLPDRHRRLLLRNSGQDALHLMFMDGYLQGLMDDFEAETQAYEPAVLFINGEYWGIHNLRERYDRHYLEATHGADPDEVVILGRLHEVDAGPAGSDEPFLALLDDLGSTSDVGPAFRDRVEAQIDVDSFFDHVIAHVYVGNWDWPNNNVRLWREPDGPDEPGAGVRDGRWRWMIFDLDHLGERVGRWNLDYDVFSHRFAPTDEPGLHDGYPRLFHRLMEDSEFRERFLTRFADRLNTTFQPERTHAELDAVVARLEDEIVLHIERWDRPETVEEWEANVERLRTFMQERPEVQRDHLADHFGLDGSSELTVWTDPERGHVRVNDLDIRPGTPGVVDPASWTGAYFHDLPVRLEAIPREGFVFAGWDGVPGANQDAEVVHVDVTMATEVTARFVPAAG